MRAHQLLFFLFSICSLLATQLSGQACDSPTAANGDYLHANNVQAFYIASGGSFFDGNDAQFRIDDPLVDAEQSIATIFAHGLWMGGYDPANNLSVSVADYGLSNDNHDYYPGPLMEDGSVTNSTCVDFDRTWSVYRYQIEAHQADFADNGAIDNPIAAVVGWPALGNAQFESINGFELPNTTQGFAAFEDLNANGIYEPLQGEYPRINQAGIIPDQILWTVFNTRGNTPSESGSLFPLSMEIQMTAWAMTCMYNPALNNTTFASYRIISREFEPLTDFRVALWSDFDLGCYTDDYVGSAPLLNTYFVYNQDNDDDMACQAGVVGAGINPPVQAISFLNQPLDNFNYYTNASASPTPPPGTTDPSTPMEYYNYMSGLFRDGTPVTSGGSGYNPGSNDVVDHAFPGDPNEFNEWSEISVALPPADRRSIGSTLIPTLNPGQIYTLDIAYSYHRVAGASHLENVSNMYTNVENIQLMYDANFAGSCSQQTICEDDCIWSGDLNADGIANHEDLLALGFGLNESGPTREGPYNWSPNDGDSWFSNQVFGADNKHLDANGNGICEEEDFFVQTVNHYNRTHSAYISTSDTSPGDDLIVIRLLGDEGLTNLSPGEGFLVEVELQNDIPDLRALAFIIEYDQNYIDNIDPMHSGESDHLSFFYDYNSLEGEGRIDYAQYALPEEEHVDGRLITAFFRIRSAFPDTLSSDETFICFRNIRGYRSDGTEIEVGADKVLVQINGIIVNTKEPDWAATISLFPNPVNDQLSIQTGNIPIDELQLFDSKGQTIAKQASNTHQLDTKNLPAGIYYLRIFSDGQFVVRKFVKMN